jgi:hypothetical protein
MRPHFQRDPTPPHSSEHCRNAFLRTGDLAQPFPEEMNRVVVSHLAALRFAATQKSAENLLREGVDPDRVHIFVVATPASIVAFPYWSSPKYRLV